MRSVNGGVFNIATNKCECKVDEFIYQDSCHPCYRFLKSNEVSSYFLQNFIQLVFNFTIKIAEVKCTDIFPKTVLDKFRQGFICNFASDFKTLTVTMGPGFNLLNESISLNLINLKGYQRECGTLYEVFKVSIRYLEDPPGPVAIIKAINPVEINCQDLNIDGSLSSGQYLTGLLYKWEFVSSISELQNYSKELTSNSCVQIDKSKLIKEVLVVKLTVYNRFNLQSSESLSLNLTDQSSLIVEFDSSIDYSCESSKKCQFFIQKILNCIEAPVFSYAWSLNNVDLLLNDISKTEFWSNQSAPDSILISLNLFPYLELEFSVVVTDLLSKTSGKSSLVIMIKPDPLNLIFDRASGFISEDNDFILTSSINTVTGPTTVVSYEWSCLLNDIPVAFPYENNSKILLVPQKYVALHLFNKITLTVTSYTIVNRRLQSLEFNDKVVVNIDLVIVSGYVPSVNIFDSQSMTKPNFISGQNIKIFKGVFKDFDHKEYNFIRKIDKVNDSVFTSPTDQVTVGIDMKKLNVGSSYQICFEVTNSKKKKFEFYYDFIVNIPPNLGIYLHSINHSYIIKRNL